MSTKTSKAAALGIELPPTAGRTCPCGCERPVSGKATYKPGHDARHAGQIGAAIAADADQRDALLARLGSPALRSKALNKANRLVLAAKKAAKVAERTAATAEAQK